MNSSSTISTKNAASNLIISNGSSYNGIYDNLELYQSVQITVDSTQNLTMTLYYSNDGIQNISSSNITITANETYINTFQIRNKYFKVTLSNNSGSSATVSLTVKLVQTPTNIIININNNDYFMSNTKTINTVELTILNNNSVYYTYIPKNTNICIIKAVGGGGGGGSAGDNASDSGGGGGAGAYAELYLCRDDISGYTHIKSVIGTAGTTTVNTGGTGGTTSVGLYNYDSETTTPILDCSGGYGGYTAGMGIASTTFYSLGGFGGTATIYQPFVSRGFTKQGFTGEHGWTAGTAYTNSIYSGAGANSELGTGGHHVMGSTTSYTVAADNVSYGGGGYGGVYTVSLPPGNGGPGKVIIIFLS
jgi:hypothetical protein